MPSSGPGGGLAADRTTWPPSRANFSGPVQALSPISRALCKAERRQAGLRESIAPQLWPIPWNVHRQAHPHGHSAFTSLAPSVFKVAIAHRRLVSLQERTVTFPSRTVGSTRLRTAPLDGMEFLRRFLPHVFPEGFMKVRHCGFRHVRAASPTDTIRQMSVPAPPGDDPPPPRQLPPRVARGPTCGTPRHSVMRRWTAARDCGDTSGEPGRGPEERRARQYGPPTAPVRPPPALWPPQAAQDGSATGSQRPADASRGSADTPIARPDHGVRHTLPTLS